MSTQVARLCPRCHRYRLRALFDLIRDALGYRYRICADCRVSGDRLVSR